MVNRFPAYLEVTGKLRLRFSRGRALDQIGGLLRGQGFSPSIHYIPTSNDFARAILLGFGWGMLPEQQSTEEIATGRLVDMAPRSAVDVSLYWQRWNLSSPLLDSVSAAVRAEARASLRPF